MNLALTYESQFDDIQLAIIEIREMLKAHYFSVYEYIF